MKSLIRLLGPQATLVLGSVAVLAIVSVAQAAPVAYTADLSGPNESPPNASPGTGMCLVEIDDVAHTMHINASFTGLVGTTTASHIHAATAVPGVANAGVATTTPSFAGFPLGVSAGVYDVLLDMTAASSYNPAYITAHGGTTAQAEADLFQAIMEGRAYLNIHSLSFPGGEIRGFLTPVPIPVESATWSRLKALVQ